MIQSTLKHDQIVNRLRNQIVAGELPPGSQLETRVKLEEQLQVSTVTIQKALDQLASEGFIVTYGRRGTFVTDHPPHLYRFALAFEDHPTSNGYAWNRFYQTILHEAIAINQGQGPRKFQLYYDIQGRDDIEDYQRLLGDMKSHRLAGIIFVTLGDSLSQSRLLDDPQLPRVSLGPVTVPGVMHILPDQVSFLRKSLDYLKSKGRRRIAHVGAGLVKPISDLFAAEVAARGMITYPYWVQGPSYVTPDAVQNAVHLLMHSGQNERPDGLVLSDDHIVEGAINGLAVAGIRTPEEVTVVAHSNFPFPPISGARIKLLGFNVRQFLVTAMDLISQVHAGNQAPALTMMPALFEEEADVKALASR